MKRPWQIWALFGLCLAMVLPTMIWLTHKAVQLERVETLAQQHAELEEVIGSALWQMDTELTQFLAVEIARPSSFYQTSSPAPDAGNDQPSKTSPPGNQPSPYVRLHFQVQPDGTWNSPQCADPQQIQAAPPHDSTQDNIGGSRQWLNELAQSVTYEDLIAHLPEQKLESHWLVDNSGAFPANTGLLPTQDKLFQNALSLPSVQQQMEQVQEELPERELDSWAQQSVVPGLNPQTMARNQRIQQRRSAELQNRDEALQVAAQQALVQNYFDPSREVSKEPEKLGVSQPVWLGTRLLLARRVEINGRTVVQGCWLDWPRIKETLLERIRPILPGADLAPVDDWQQVPFHRVLATLPVQLVIGEWTPTIYPRSPIHLPLWIAWALMALATVAMALLVRGVVALSERRAAFVSAVTHELRTPLTTFQMYAEMLAEGMVSEEGQRAEYLQTLREEAQRLTHLVENVLQYARLERNSQGRRREAVHLDLLLQRIEPRLRDRAEQAEMTIVRECDETLCGISISTDPAAVEQILFNLVDNACKYARAGNDRRIHCRLQLDRREVRIEIWDHGPGLAKAAVRHLFRPFCKSAQAAADSAPGVGLGLALSHRLARQLGGRLEYSRNNCPGASFTLRLPR
jgi:signal transduction histidine kinase